MSQFAITSGRCFPLGASFISSDQLNASAENDGGTNFALFSALLLNEVGTTQGLTTHLSLVPYINR